MATVESRAIQYGDLADVTAEREIRLLRKLSDILAQIQHTCCNA
jgi:hypothetical protein